jgi:hypothetical protein
MTQPFPDFASYHAALTSHQEEEVTFTVHVRTLATLVATLQFALQDPTCPDSLPGIIEGFLEAAIDRLYRIDPIIGRVAEAGTHDRGETDDEYAEMFLFREGQAVYWAEAPDERFVVVERRWTQRELLGPVIEYRLRTQVDSTTLGLVMTPWVSEADLETRE